MNPKTKQNPKGAGRKRREVPRVAITVRLEPWMAEDFKRVCKSAGISQNKQLVKLIWRMVS